MPDNVSEVKDQEASICTSQTADHRLAGDSAELKDQEEQNMSSDEEKKDSSASATDGGTENSRNIEGRKCSTDGSCDVPESTSSTDTIKMDAMEEKEKIKEWTVGDLKDDYRRFCFDLSPKVSCLPFNMDLHVPKWKMTFKTAMTNEYRYTEG